MTGSCVWLYCYLKIFIIGRLSPNRKVRRGKWKQEGKQFFFMSVRSLPADIHKGGLGQKPAVGVGHRRSSFAQELLTMLCAREQGMVKGKGTQYSFAL